MPASETAAPTPLPGGLARTPTSRRGQAKRAKLLAAAEECFGRLGYNNASVAEIVRVAGVSQGGFYVYFEGKDAIFRELVMDISRQIRAASRAAIEGAATQQEAELAGTRAFLQWLAEHPRMHRVLHLIDEVDIELSEEFFSSVSRPYAKRLRAGMESGEVDPVDPELLAFALMGVNNFVSMRWVLWTGKPFPADLIDDLNKIILRMLGHGSDGLGVTASE
jgi:AcrR family transcriptional regulator